MGRYSRVTLKDFENLKIKYFKMNKKKKMSVQFQNVLENVQERKLEKERRDYMFSQL